MSKIHRPTERVIDILDIVSKYKDGISFMEISNEIEIPKGTLSPILQTLVEKKMLSLNVNTLKYKMGAKSFKIGYAFTESINIIETIKVEMQYIVDECHEICQLGILDGRYVLYMAKVEPVQSIKLESSVGKSLPAHATALGKCLLSRYQDEEIKEMYKKGMKKRTDATITDINKLIEAVETVRQTHISYEWGESNEQVMCLAVPIYYEGRAIFSISVSVPMYRAEKEKLDLIESILLKKKEKIEKQIELLEVSDIIL